MLPGDLLHAEAGGLVGLVGGKFICVHAVPLKQLLLGFRGKCWVSFSSHPREASRPGAVVVVLVVVVVVVAALGRGGNSGSV